MGLFDFFKKKDNNELQNSETPKSELFLAISKYNEYIVRFIGMQQQGNYAPISAYEKSSGEIVGFLFIVGEDTSYTLSAEEVINRMEANFEQKLKNKEIKSYVILYHSQFNNDNNHQFANNDNELKAITVAYNLDKEQKGKIGLTYQFENNEITYQGFRDFSQEENNIIFQTQLKENKDYFQDREEIKAPIMENEIGLKIKKSNSFDLSNTWCGIFGFESYRQPNGSQALKEHFALAMYKGKTFNNDNVKISQLEYQDIILKGVSLNEKAITILPVVKTNKIINVENKDIDEWENVENLEAVVSGNGKDTFGVWYFATDYAENRRRYLTEKKLNIKLSGIAFVLDTHNEDYTAYMPSKDLPNYGCFDFIGLLIDYKPTNLLENNSQQGYILTVKLITHPEIEDFFSIDIFVTRENMRFKELTKGMKISGMFQMQGQIAD